MPTGDPDDEEAHKQRMGRPSTGRGQWNELIEKHAKRVGLDPEYMKRVMKIESGGDPGNRTGSYKGLFQLSDKEFGAHGGSGNIYDPEQNVMAASNMFAKQQLAFKEKYGRDMKPIDRYMVHQQGAAGYSAHLANPDKPAWENIRQYYSSDEMAKKAVWGNIPDKDKKRFGSVDTVTSAQFVNDVWASRVEGGEAEFGGEAVASDRYRGGRRSAAREGSNPEMDFLEAPEPKKKTNLFETEFEQVNPQFGNLVPRFSIGKG
jgi:Transglycosylase SLT domain